MGTGLAFILGLIGKHEELSSVSALSIAVLGASLSGQPSEASREGNEQGAGEHSLQKVVQANNAFCFDLYSELNQDEEGNIFLSPYSISVALAMTYEGAKGKTEEEMKEVLHFPEDRKLRNGYRSFHEQMKKDADAYRLTASNAVWRQEGSPMVQTYLDRIENYYGGGVREVDFKEDPQGVTKRINDTIAEETEDMIEGLLPRGAITPSTKLVLTNAVHFKGEWLHAFDTSATAGRDFHLSSGNTVNVPMMKMVPKEKLSYAELDELKLLELPYKGKAFSMFLLLPKEGSSLEELESTLRVERLNAYKDSLAPTDLRSVTLPKFRSECKYGLKPVLSHMGMKTAFTPKADFSGIAKGAGFRIDQVIHQARIEWDERGTEAAAATAVTTRVSKRAELPPFFKADRPFLFMVQANESGKILFMGRVKDPRE